MFNTRHFVAQILGILKQQGEQSAPAITALISKWKEEGDFLQSTTYRGWRGSGNKARRRAGEEVRSFSCGCDICVVYGGDCTSQMYQEARSEAHREQRGKKTKASKLWHQWAGEVARTAESDYYNDRADDLAEFGEVL